MGGDIVGHAYLSLLNCKNCRYVKWPEFLLLPICLWPDSLNIDLAETGNNTLKDFKKINNISVFL